MKVFRNNLYKDNKMIWRNVTLTRSGVHPPETPRQYCLDPIEKKLPRHPLKIGLANK